MSERKNQPHLHAHVRSCAQQLHGTKHICIAADAIANWLIQLGLHIVLRFAGQGVVAAELGLQKKLVGSELVPVSENMCAHIDAPVAHAGCV